MRIAIIGAGLQMRRRASAILQSPDDTVVEVVGTPCQKRPEDLLNQLGAAWGIDYRHTIERKDLDAIIVCTPPHIHADISIAALRSGKHVLCEKPLSRTIGEGQSMINAARE